MVAICAADDVLSVNVTHNIPEAIRKVANALGVLGKGTADPDINRAFKQVGARILGFQRRRFLTLSRSGGSSEWPDLAIATKIRRLTKTKAQREKLAKGIQSARDKRALKGQGGRLTRLKYLSDAAHGVKLPILVDTGLLFNSLTLHSPGNISEMIPDGVRVGTAIRYAQYHQYPTKSGRPPVRKIIGELDSQTMSDVAKIAMTGVERAIQRRLKR